MKHNALGQNVNEEEGEADDDDDDDEEERLSVARLSLRSPWFEPISHYVWVLC
jgi:hypothetical protein